ncbi:MAG: SDR family NAD(P)-dependent oxidoreductase [Bacteroidales bacterium]|nr:SDR family NAD(P)-dependent oxidoreductase [Bacteroidales bacterium]
METYTLITGSSQGIGKGYAMEFAKRGYNVLLVALPDSKLEETATEIKEKYQVKVAILPIDLAEKDAPQNVYNWCKENDYIVDILVNNAGVAGTTIFEESPLDYSDMRIQVNIRALVLLCRLFIPDLKKLPKAYILNTGSLSAYYSIPYKSVYSASKAFVLTFSKAIRDELHGSSVSVSVVNPNGVYTNDGTFGRINAHGAKGRLTATTAEQLAVIAIDEMFKGKGVIIPKFVNKFLLFLQKLIPAKLEQSILRKEFMKEVKVS